MAWYGVVQQPNGRQRLSSGYIVEPAGGRYGMAAV